MCRGLTECSVMEAVTMLLVTGMPQDYTPKRLGWTLPPLISFLTSADLPTNHEGVLCLHVVISLLFFQFSRLS